MWPPWPGDPRGCGIISPEASQTRRSAGSSGGLPTGMRQFPRHLAILGSTGSIGRQTLDVVRAFPQHFRVVALAARENAGLLAEQAAEFAPELVALSSADAAAHARLRAALPDGTRLA